MVVAVTVSILAACSGDDDGGPLYPQPDRSANLCVFLGDGDPETLQEILDDYGLELVSVYGDGRCALLRGAYDPAVLAEDGRILAFQRDARLAISSPVELTMSFYEGEFEDDLPAQDAFTGWYLDQVHQIGKGAGVKVAVLDTGVDPTHPLLQGRVQMIAEGEWQLGSLEIARGVDTDGDGEFDEAYGHGTHVAGIIASVAPQAEILALRVLDSDGVGTAFDLATALYRAVQWGADVINLSLVLDGEADVIVRVLGDLSNRKIMVVGAAGNVPGKPFFPATQSEVISIAAMDANFLLADFSAYDGVRLAAPGVEVLSAFPGGRWASASGTSMASASASGALAVLAGIVGSAEDARGILSNTAVDLDPVNDGAIDLMAAAQDAAIRALRRR